MATLQSSGAISISQINAEFGRGNNLNAYRGTTWYTDAGGSGTFSSGAISMSEFYSKRATPAITISLTTLNGIYGTAYPGQTAYSESIWSPNGVLQEGTSNMGIQSAGNWASPTTTGIGSGYWVRFTETSSSGAGQTVYGSARGVWHQLSSAHTFGVSRTLNGGGYRTYTVEISTNSSGTNIVATKTGVELYPEIIF